MRKILLLSALLMAGTSLFAQHRVQTDTLKIRGRVVGYTVTNWYCIEGDKCPDFTVYDENGRTIHSRDLRGKTTVISFWISSCGPCRKELNRVGPELIDVYSPDEFAFLAIGSGENAAGAKKFRELCGATFPLYYDPTNKVFGKFADNGFPKLFVVDKKGIVRMVEKGYNDEKFNHLKNMVRKLVEEEVD